MTPESKRCTIEQSLKLQELGVVLKVEMHWVRSIGTVNTPSEWVLVSRQGTIDQGIDPDVFTNAYHPAPDVAELGEILLDNGYLIIWGGQKSEVIMAGRNWSPIYKWIRLKKQTEAQARCAALIWLIENKHLDPKEIKLLA